MKICFYLYALLKFRQSFLFCLRDPKLEISTIGSLGQVFRKMGVLFLTFLIPDTMLRMSDMKFALKNLEGIFINILLNITRKWYNYSPGCSKL